MLKPSKCSPCRHFTRWQTCRSSIPIIPAIVESLHSECSEQFALNDARTAFLLPNCICKHKSQLACAPQTCVEPLLTRMMKDKRYTHTCGWCFSAVPVWGAEKGKRHNVTFYLSSLHPQLAYSLEASRHTGTLKKTKYKQKLEYKETKCSLIKCLISKCEAFWHPTLHHLSSSAAPQRWVLPSWNQPALEPQTLLDSGLCIN